MEELENRWTEVFALKDQERREALRKLGIRLSDADFSKAEEAAKDQEPGKKLWNAVVECWVETNPKQAACWAYHLTLVVETEKDDILEFAAKVASL